MQVIGSPFDVGNAYCLESELLFPLDRMFLARLELEFLISLVRVSVQVEGRIFVRLDQGKDKQKWKLTVGCTLAGKWILHWGISRVDDAGRYGYFEVENASEHLRI